MNRLTTATALALIALTGAGWDHPKEEQDKDVLAEEEAESLGPPLFRNVTSASGANWSYVRPATPGSDRVAETTEKRPVSDLCCTGLYHFAIRYPTRRDLAAAVRRVIQAGIPIQGVADHGVSESIYLADVDGNGIELTRDRPETEWPRTPDGKIAMHMADPLDLDALLQEAN